MNHLRKNLTTLSFEVILAIVGFGLSFWFLSETSIAYADKQCVDKVDTDVPCKKSAVQIAILSLMLVLSIIMLIWGAATC